MCWGAKRIWPKSSAALHKTCRGCARLGTSQRSTFCALRLNRVFPVRCCAPIFTRKAGRPCLQRYWQPATSISPLKGLLIHPVPRRPLHDGLGIPVFVVWLTFFQAIKNPASQAGLLNQSPGRDLLNLRHLETISCTQKIPPRHHWRNPSELSSALSSTPQSTIAGCICSRWGGGINAEDALHTAKVLASGMGQICQHMHDSLNLGELAYCDAMATLKFLSETVSTLVWSVEMGSASSAEVSSHE